MSAANYIFLNPGRTFVKIQPREARVADSHILSAAQRFAHRGMHLFGARTAPVAQWQKYGGVQDFVTLAMLANKN